MKPIFWYHPISGRIRFEETKNWMPLYYEKQTDARAALAKIIELWPGSEAIPSPMDPASASLLQVLDEIRDVAMRGVH